MNTFQSMAEQFRFFSQTVFAKSSPLYTHLSAAAADDDALMAALQPYHERRMFPLLFMAAVHDVLLSGVPSPLAEYYPDLHNQPRRPVGAYPALRNFFDLQRDAIMARLENGLVQTNEVRRCATLLPAFTFIARESGMPLGLIEIGASMGLNLNWHRYLYAYDDGRSVGPVNVGVHLTCEVRGPKRIPMPATIPTISSIEGIDLNPLDIHNPDDVRWLRALIWPEHLERRDRLDAALLIAAEHPPCVHRGDGRAWLPQLLPAIAADAVPVIFHSYALVQLAPEQRAAIYAPIIAASHQRPHYRLQLEWYRDMDDPEIWLYRYDKGNVNERKLARVGAHGSWIEWLV